MGLTGLGRLAAWFLVSVAALCASATTTSSEPAPAPQKSVVPSDHPLVTGMLTGEARERRLREFVSAKEARKKQGRDAADLYRTFLDDVGVKRMAEHFESRDRFCHGAAHPLGMAVAERTGDLATAVAVCGDACTYGCVHGVFKTHFSRRGKAHDSAHERAPLTPVDLERVGLEVEAACREDSALVPNFFRGNCAHGVGHAFGVLAPAVKTAASYCGVFDDAEMQYYCETGIFMEMDDAIKAGLYPDGISREARLQAGVGYCVANSDVPGACMRFLLPRHRHLADVASFAETCLGMEGSGRSGCFNVMGFLGRSYAVAHPRDAGRICRYGALADRRLCVSGLVFTKKENRKKEGLAAACRYFDQPELAAVCEDQSTRFYYQVDNPVMDLMFSDRTDAP